MAFPTKRFNLDIPKNMGCSWALIGSSKSGKTTLLKHIYNEYYKKYCTIMFSMNAHAEIYKDLDKNVIVCDTFHPSLFAEAHEINTKCNNKFPFLFISDDYVDSAIKSSPEVLRALTIYRNANMTSIFVFQGRTLMNSVGRNQVNYVCVFKQQTPKEWKAVIEEFLSMWLPMGMTMAEMINFCMEATKNHQFFLIDNIVGECYISKLAPSQI